MNVERVKEAINDSGMTMKAIAEKSGIDRFKLYNRLKGIGEFTVPEVVGLQKALRLTDEERDKIFFVD